MMVRLCTLILALTCAVPAAAQPRDQYITVNIMLLGNSTGGRVVQVFAGLHPELVLRSYAHYGRSGRKTAG